jgi:hypothetical protein
VAGSGWSRSARDQQVLAEPEKTCIIRLLRVNFFAKWQEVAPSYMVPARPG